VSLPPFLLVLLCQKPYRPLGDRADVPNGNTTFEQLFYQFLKTSPEILLSARR